MAVAMNKGGVDFDDVNARMAPENQSRANEILRALKAWDNEKQLAAVGTTDPTWAPTDGFRPGAINMN